MRTTIDGAGRVVIPKRLRDRLGLAAGVELEVEHCDGVIQLRRHGPAVVLIEQAGRLVFTTTEPTPPMTDDELFHLIDESREWPRHY